MFRQISQTMERLKATLNSEVVSATQPAPHRTPEADPSSAVHAMSSDQTLTVTAQTPAPAATHPPVAINLDLTEPLPATGRHGQPTADRRARPEAMGLAARLNLLPNYLPPQTGEITTPHAALRLSHELDHLGREVMRRVVDEVRAGRVRPAEAARLLLPESPAWQGSTGWNAPLSLREIILGLQSLRERPVHAAPICPDCGANHSALHQRLTLRTEHDVTARSVDGGNRECLNCGLICDDLHFWDAPAGEEA